VNDWRALTWQLPVVPLEPEQQPDQSRDVCPVALAVKFTEHAVTTPLFFRGWHVVPDAGESDTVGAAAGVFGFTVIVVRIGVAVSPFLASYLAVPVSVG
jgi:hypothetical protein